MFESQMSTKRVQLTNLDRKVICELAIEHKALTQDKLTALIRNKLEKPFYVLEKVDQSFRFTWSSFNRYIRRPLDFVLSISSRAADFTLNPKP